MYFALYTLTRSLGHSAPSLLATAVGLEALWPQRALLGAFGPLFYSIIQITFQESCSDTVNSIIHSL